MAAPRIQFRPGEKLASELIERLPQRGDITDAQRDILLAEEVREMLEAHAFMLRRCTPTFTMNDAMLIMDALNGVLLMKETVHLIWAEISDAIHMDGLDKKHNVDGDALVKRLRDMGQRPFECMALADAVSRAWNASEYHVENLEERLKVVGLVNDSAAIAAKGE